MKGLEEKAQGRSVNRKTKTERKALKEKHGKYCKFMIMCQGVSHWMKDEVEEAGPQPEKQEQKGVTAELVTPTAYPCLTQLPSAPPPPCIFPVITLERGSVWGPRGETGTVTGGFVDFQYDSRQTTKPEKGAMGRVIQPERAAETSQGPIIAEGSISLPPLSPVPPRNSQVSPERGVKTAQTEAPRSSGSGARQHVEEEEETQWTDEESEGDDPGPQFQGLPTPMRERNLEIGIDSKPMGDQWVGKVIGKLHEDERWKERCWRWNAGKGRRRR